MNILISGGSGLMGSVLVKKLEQRGHNLRILVRKMAGKPNEFLWNVNEDYIDEKALENLDCIIHLAGASISEKWSKTHKKQIISSRIDTANLLYKKIKEHNIHLKCFVSALGINYYGTFTTDHIFTETDSTKHLDFLSGVCQQWESSAKQFQNSAERLVILRISPVLSKNGGAFEYLQRLTKYNLASGIGSGKQWFPWIHIEDLVNIFVYSIENQNVNGIYNAVADEIPTQREFMNVLAKKSNKFFIPFNVPKFLVQFAMGEMSEIILEGSRASNNKIKSEGFAFQFPNLDSAFNDLLAQ